VPTVFADDKDAVTVEINGVKVVSENHYMKNGKVYVDVDAYADLLGESVAYDNATKTAIVGGATFPASAEGGDVTAWIRDVAQATGAVEVTFEDNEAIDNVYVLMLPEGAKPYHPPIPGMGQHWIVASQEAIDAEAAGTGTIDFHTTTIYGTHAGKLIFIEQMLDHAFFSEADGAEDFLRLAGMEGLPSPSIEHTDIDFQPAGHPGFLSPHFDIHHYFVTHEEHMAIPAEAEHH